MVDILPSDHRIRAAALRAAGIAATRVGRRVRARRYLHQSISLDAGVGEAWFCLARLATTPQASAFYLRHGLAIDPHNSWAQAELCRAEEQLDIQRTHARLLSAPTSGMAAPTIPSPVRLPPLSSFGPFPGHLQELLVAVGYLLVMGLAQAVVLWGDPSVRIVLYGLILLALFFGTAFGRENRIRRPCLLLVLIPLHHIVSAFVPADVFHPLGRYLVVTGALSAATLLLIYDLSFRPTSIGLELGIGLFSFLVYVLIALTGLLFGLVELYLVKPSPLASPPASAGATAVALLIALLVLKRLAPSPEARVRAFRRSVNVAVIPLLITFFVAIGVRISDLLVQGAG